MSTFAWTLKLASWLYLPLTLVVAAIWGGRDERVTVGMFVTALVATHFAIRDFEHRFASPELGVFLVDVFLAIALIVLALRSNRFWPLWATSFHLLAVYTHAATYLVSSITAFPYAILAGWWSWPTQGALAIGVIEYRRRPSASVKEIEDHHGVEPFD